MTDTATSTVGEEGGAGAPRLVHSGGGIELPSQMLDDVELEVVAILGKTRMTFHELKELRIQSSIALDTPVQSDILIEVNGKPIAHGEVVEIGGQELGVRITKLLDGSSQ